MAITKLNSLAIPDNTIVEADLSYPLTSFSSTGIDDNATSTAITIDASENVGIGVTDPDVELEVQSAEPTLKISNNVAKTAGEATVGQIEFAQHFGTQSSSSIKGIEIGGSTSYVTGALTFSTRPSGGSLTERLRIDNAGVVSIKESGGAANLQMYSSGTSGFLKGNRGVTTEIELGAADITFDSGGTPIMTLKHGGNVGIGDTTPDSNLVGGISASGVLLGRYDTTSGAPSPAGRAFYCAAASNAGGYTSGSLLLGARPDANNRHIHFFTADQERMRILSSGGITFNGDTAAANALDDYEEGTHIATLSAGTSGALGLNSSYQTLRYVKIGNLVHVVGYLNINAVSSPTGILYISMPFYNASGYAHSAAVSLRFNNVVSGAVNDFWPEIGQAMNSITVYLGSSNNVTGAAHLMKAGTDIRVSATYYTS